MKRISPLLLAWAVAIVFAACGDDATPTDPGTPVEPPLKTETCIDCHSNEAALKASAAATTANGPEVIVGVAGDG